MGGLFVNVSGIVYSRIHTFLHTVNATLFPVR
jgi:hypothetical protein